MSERKRGARASRAPWLASRQTHLRPKPIAHDETLRSNWSKTGFGKKRRRAVRHIRRCCGGTAKKGGKENLKNHENRKISFCHFSMGNCCHPIGSNQNSSRRFYGSYVNFTLGYGGEGGWKGRIMKAELRNCKRSANGVVKMTELRFTRLTNQTPSQSVAVSRSDIGEDMTTSLPCSLAMKRGFWLAFSGS